MDSNYIFMTRRIGTTTYKVKIFPNETSSETMENKILRLIVNHPLASGEKCGIIGIPQMSRSA